MNTHRNPSFDDYPDSAYIRASQLVHNRKHPERATPLPFCAATLWRKVKSGEIPAPIALSPQMRAWRVGDIRAYMAGLAGAKSGAPVSVGVAA